jgi:nitrogen regulatory protein PII
MYMILFVLHDAEKLTDLLDAWEGAGVPGVTILHSSGLGRVRQAGLRDDLPLMPSLEDLFNDEEYFNRTIFSIVQGEEVIERVVKATEKVVGDLMQPNAGLLVVLPVAKVYGLRRYQPGEENG